ncbi:ankyrin repeat domain-containing protein 24-like isoform X3 [Mercenaria mercenaria]|uniref:ankyrin repeat domain-containing protein 24-like isoform X3 n=1 Tax=Mercenaria mercenaria TaxID=6596 RepID=UPI00234F3CB1|nr:ankyrin repeat domain-containing protein 24-like isoform X3 [Mercenaria mercenaria]
MSKKEHKQSKMKSLFKGFRKSTTDLSEWSKNDEKLMKAVENNDIAKADELLKKKSLNPTKLGPKGLSVFHVACSLGYLDLITLLISHGAEVNVLSIQGNTSVQLAARDGHPRILEKLIEAGGVIDHKDGLSLTALHHACVRGKISCVQVLLKHGADPNSRDKTGKPPLFYAAFSEDLPICKELVDKGANVNAHDEQQLTALMAAAKKGSKEICEFLLKKGANPKFCDKAGHDALSYGLDSGFDNLRDVFSRAPTQAQWSVNQQDTGTSNLAEKTKADVAEAAAAPPVPQVVMETEMVEEPHNKENMVAKFVMESTPERVHRVPEPSKESDEEELDEETLALRAASPPKSVIDQRTLEAYKAKRQMELEEENEHINQDLKRVTLEHKRLQESYDALKKQLSTPAPPPVDQEEVQELEDELSTLKSQLTEEQDKNVRLIDKMKKLKKKFKVPDEQGEESGEDSWNDSDEDELFEGRKPTVVVDHKPQTLLLLQNQVSQLRQDNKQLRERLHKNGTTITSLFGWREKTGSISSLASLDDTSEIERLRRRLEEIETDRQRLQVQIQENGVFPEEQMQNLRVLEEENTQLHSQVKQLKTEIIQIKSSKDTQNAVNLTNGELNETVEGKLELESAIQPKRSESSEQLPANMALQELDDIRKENTALQSENSLLTEELEALRDTYNKLVIAGDNLQEMYDQLVLEKEQMHEEMENMAKAKQELARENEYLLADGNAMHDDIERLVHEVEKLHDQNQSTVKEKEDIERKLSALNQSNKASDFARVVEERDKLRERVEESEKLCEELKQNHDIVIEEVQSVQAACQRAEYERDQIQQEFDSLQDEFENVQGSHEGLQQDYNQLEQDYSDLLADKEKLEQEFLDVQTASVNVENHNPAVVQEKDRLQQENEVLVMEKEQLEMTMKELSKSNALIQEELASLRSALELDEKKEQKDSNKQDNIVNTEPQIATGNNKEVMDKATIDAVVEKDRRIRSLQIQISRLQQQLAEADRHYRDVISTYRTHLLSAVQGHMDPDVKQALYNIIELRSMEQFC